MEQKHLLYLAPTVDFGNQGAVGIRKKVIGQCEAFGRLGYATTLVMYENGNVVIRNPNGEFSTYQYSKLLWAMGCCKSIIKKLVLKHNKKFDTLYIRKALAETPFTLSAIKFLSKHSDKVICEIPTYPYDEEMRGTYKRYDFKKKLQVFPFYLFGVFFSDKIFRNQLHKYVDCFAVITDLQSCDTAFKAPAIKMSNGIDVRNMPLRDKTPDDTLSLIAVAGVSYWHGYDRVISGMHEYYKHGGDKKIVFHIVGYGAAIGELTQLAKDLDLESQVIFHGVKTGAELDKLFGGADLGVATFGGHRLDRDIDSDLKVCEYCARALPYITSMRDTDIPDSFTWKLLMANEEAPIDFNSVIAFHEKCLSNSENLIGMRDFAEENLSWDVHLKTVLDFPK